MLAAGRLAEATGAPSRVLSAAERHAGLARRLTPRSQLEQVLLDRGVTDPVLLERAAAADRLTRQVMADAYASQPRSPAATCAPPAGHHPRAGRGAGPGSGPAGWRHPGHGRRDAGTRAGARARAG